MLDKILCGLILLIVMYLYKIVLLFIILWSLTKIMLIFYMRILRKHC